MQDSSLKQRRRRRALTPYPDLDEAIGQHAKGIEDVLGANLLGYYLVGSLAIGDFDLSSDVDLLVVLHEDLSQREVGAVQAFHQQTYQQENRWVKRLEYSFFPKNPLRTPSSPYGRDGRNDDEQRVLWYFDNGSRTIERSDHDNTLVARWTLRELGIVVSGPSPGPLIDPIAPNTLRAEIRNTLTGWGNELLADPEPFRNRFYQEYLVLNHCRMLHDLSEGRISSKRAGVEWAKSNLDRKWRGLIDTCWKDRQDSQDPSIAISQPADPAIFEHTLAFVRNAIDLATTFKMPR